MTKKYNREKKKRRKKKEENINVGGEKA